MVGLISVGEGGIGLFLVKWMVTFNGVSVWAIDVINFVRDYFIWLSHVSLLTNAYFTNGLAISIAITLFIIYTFVTISTLTLFIILTIFPSIPNTSPTYTPSSTHTPYSIYP